MLLLLSFYLFFYLKQLSLLTVLHIHRVSMSCFVLVLLMSTDAWSYRDRSYWFRWFSSYSILSPTEAPPNPSIDLLIAFRKGTGLLLILILFITFFVLSLLYCLSLFLMLRLLRQFQIFNFLNPQKNIIIFSTLLQTKGFKLQAVLDFQVNITN